MFSTHAELRLYEHSSKSNPKDVKMVLQAGASIVVGRNGKAAFELFYSPADSSCYVAVLSLDRNTLITVLPVSYQMPRGVRPITSKLLRQAKRRYLDMFFASFTSASEDEPVLGRVVLHCGQEMSWHAFTPEADIERVGNWREAVRQALPVLKSLVPVQDNQPGVPVQYHILFRTTKGALLADYVVPHNKKLRKLVSQYT